MAGPLAPLRAMTPLRPRCARVRPCASTGPPLGGKAGARSKQPWKRAKGGRPPPPGFIEDVNVATGLPKTEAER